MRAEAIKPIGRPPHSRELRLRTLIRVRRHLGGLGWSTGWPAMCRLLPDAPVMLIHDALGALKKRRGERLRQEAAARRTSLTVLAKGAVLCQDAFQKGRVHADITRDRATMRIEAVSAGGPGTAADTITGLEILRASGRLPLVFQTDNGSQYKADAVQEYLAKNRVTGLRNLPRTPQHNPSAERAVREVKSSVDLDECSNPADACQEIARKVVLRNSTLPRQSKGWKTADELDAIIPPWYLSVHREVFYCAVQEGKRLLPAGMKPRERRKAEREVVFQALERFGLAVRTTGGVISRPKKPEINL